MRRTTGIGGEREHVRSNQDFGPAVVNPVRERLDPLLQAEFEGFHPLVLRLEPIDEPADVVEGDLAFADHDVVPPGAVVATDPPVGTRIERDAEVTLVLSAGRAQVGVPDVTGGTVARATERLEAMGFVVSTSHRLVAEGGPGVGAVLGFVPQMLILFFMLAVLEYSGYMARIAFIMDRAFRKWGLSGKSFIPLLIGSGCSVPGIMASRTIEEERDRRMTIITTTFIPCGAKLPIIALIAAALFDRAAWVAPSAYFIGIAAIITSGMAMLRAPATSATVTLHRNRGIRVCDGGLTFFGSGAAPSIRVPSRPFLQIQVPGISASSANGTSYSSPLSQR